MRLNHLYGQLTFGLVVKDNTLCVGGNEFEI
jgi:hypothetical protein